MTSDLIHWPDSVVRTELGITFYVNLSGSGDDGGFLSAVEAAAQTWEDDPGSYMNFTSKGVGDVRNSSLRNKMDGTNAVTWDNLRRYPGAIAVTFTWYNTQTLEIVEIDLAFNKAKGFNWTSNLGFSGDPDTGTGDPTAYDVQNIATHEFGHWLLLNDLYEDNQRNLTMYGYSAEGELKKRTLGPGDTKGIQAIYLEGPSTDIAIDSVSAPSPVLEGDAVNVDVIVKNVGNQNVASDIDVTLTDDTDSVPIGIETISGGLSAGASTTLTYSWDTTGASLGDHTLTASHDFSDDNATNNSKSTVVTVNAAGAVTVTSIVPDTMQAGTTVAVTITGTGFVNGADVTFENGAGPSPTVSNVVVNSSTNITGTVTAKSAGPPRSRVWDVRVTNPDGSSGVLPGGFTVTS